MSYLHFKIDPREAAYGRLVSGVLGVLRRAVQSRVDQGAKRMDIAAAADLSAGHLSRILNGNVRNLTLRTVSDLLWATKHDPRDFEADRFEDLSGNGSHQEIDSVEMSKPVSPAKIVSGGTYIKLTPEVPRPISSENSACR